MTPRLLFASVVAVLGAGVVLAGGGVSGATALAIGVGGAQAAGGKLDLSFGRGGKVLTDLGGSNEASAVAIEADGKIVAAGGHDLVRYTSGGRPDRSFGSGGKLTDLRVPTAALIVQADGKMVVGGDSFALARYTSGGKLDRSFGRGGTVFTDFGGSFTSARAMAVQADGKIVLVGSVTLRNPMSGAPAKDATFFALVRYTKDGRLDRDFGSSGRAEDVGGTWGEAHAVAIQDDGKIVVAGYSTRGFALVRYTRSGRLDRSFGAGGRVFTVFTDRDDKAEADALAVQEDGKIVAAGYTATRSGGNAFALARYTSSGRLDASFGRSGKTVTRFGNGWGGQAHALAVQRDGKIVAAGLSNANHPALPASRARDFALVRYTS